MPPATSPLIAGMVPASGGSGSTPKASGTAGTSTSALIAGMKPNTPSATPTAPITTASSTAISPLISSMKTGTSTAPAATSMPASSPAAPNVSSLVASTPPPPETTTWFSKFLNTNALSPTIGKPQTSTPAAATPTPSSENVIGPDGKITIDTNNLLGALPALSSKLSTDINAPFTDAANALSNTTYIKQAAAGINAGSGTAAVAVLQKLSDFNPLQIASGITGGIYQDPNEQKQNAANATATTAANAVDPKEATYLTTAGTALSAQSASITSAQTALVALKMKIDSAKESLDPTNAKAVASFNTMVDQYNTQAAALQIQVDSYNSTLGEYQTRSDIFNAKVLTAQSAEANAKASGGDFVDGLLTGITKGIGSVIGIVAGGELATPSDAANALNTLFRQYPLLAKYAIPYTEDFVKSLVGLSLQSQLNPDLAGSLTKRAEALATSIATAPFYTALGLIKNTGGSMAASFALGFGMAKLSGASNTEAAQSGLVLGLMDGGTRTLGGSTRGINFEEAQTKLKTEALATLSPYAPKPLTEDSTLAEIKYAYHKAAFQTHPDMGGTDKAFVAVKGAYDLLSQGAVSSNPNATDEASPTTEPEQNLKTLTDEIKQRVIENGEDATQLALQENLGIDSSTATRLVTASRQSIADPDKVLADIINSNPKVDSISLTGKIENIDLPQGMNSIRKTEQALTTAGFTTQEIKDILTEAADKIRLSTGKTSINTADIIDAIHAIERVKESATTFEKQVAETTSSPKERGNKNLAELAQNASKYSSEKEMRNAEGIVPEWGTANPYMRDNPYRKQLDAMSKTGNFDEEIIKKSDQWELEQVLKDKPAFLNNGNISNEEVMAFADKHNLYTTTTGDGDMIVAKNEAAANRVIDAIEKQGGQRDLGLALGYTDLGDSFGKNPQEAKKRFTDFFNKVNGNANRGFINPGVIAEPFIEGAKYINDLAEANTKTLELSNEKAEDLYKLKGEDQADIETAYKILQTLPLLSGDDNALYHKQEESLNPNEKLPELTETQQNFQDHIITPLIKLADDANKVIDASGLPELKDNGYIHRLPKGRNTVGDTMFNPEKGEEPTFRASGLLRKTDNSDKARTMYAITNDKTGERTVVSIKNHPFVIPAGKRSGDVIRSKRVTAFTGKDTEPTDLARFKVKTKEQLQESEIKPLQKKIDTVQTQIDALNRIKIKDPVSASKTGALEERVDDLINTLAGGREFYTQKELKPELKSLRATQAKLKLLKSIKTADQISNVEDRLNDLQDTIRKLSNKMGEIEMKYDENSMDKRMFIAKDKTQYTIGQATTKEISDNSKIEYWESAIVSNLSHALSRMKIARAIKLMDAWKNAPDADLIFSKRDKPQPEGFTTTLMPQFRDMYVEARTAAVLDDFYHQLKKSPEKADQILSSANRVITHAVFFSPFIHPINTASTWFVDQGANWINPLAWKGNVTAMARAIDAIRTKNGDYMHAMREGVPFQASLIGSDDLANLIQKKIGDNLDKGGENNTLAQQLGFDHVVSLKNAIGRAWHSAAFKAGDVFFLQAVYQRMEQTGMDFPTAFKDASRFNLTYRIPSTLTLPTKIGSVIGSRTIAKAFQNSDGFFLAARYHVDLFKILGSIAHDLISPKEGFSKEGARTRGRSLGKAAMLALAAYFLLHEGKKAVDWLTNNPLAYFAGGGDIKMVIDFTRLLQGDSSPSTFASSLMPVAPLWQGGAELALDRDAYTGDPIYGAPNAIGFGAFGTSLLAPLQSASEYTPSAFLYSFLSIHDPSTSQAAVRFDSLVYDVKPGLNAQIKQDIVQGDTALAQTQIEQFNQQIISNYQQDHLEKGLAPLTQTDIPAFLAQYGISAPGAVALANAQQIYNDNQVANKTKLITSIVAYAEAVGTDPLTAFNRIFTGQRILRVDNPGFLNQDGAIIVQRLPLASSEAVRTQDATTQGLSQTQMDGLQLDHTIPLEAGGSNEAYNLDLVTTQQNQVDNALVETPIAAALRAGTISRANAMEYIIRYKIGTLKESPNSYYQDLYKNQYDSQPITAQEVIDLINSGKAK